MSGARADRLALASDYPFPLDRFQLDALDVLDRGESVLVAAPTGSGKTVVAEYAIAVALDVGRRAFYTAPIKALSNQKYHDLALRHGSRRVGLLTGDNSINPDAPVVVMTTEVLRNMIYARSSALADLDVVVLDEVHYLQDSYRGPVWEEVIIHLPDHVRLVCLSATVSNAQELAQWITTIRGTTAAVVETRRPVRLEQLYLVGDRSAERPQLLPTIVDGRPNPEASRLDSERAQLRHRAPRRPGPARRRTLYTPSRLEVIETLQGRDLLPAIEFIFSRNQCDEAVRHLLAAGVRLTSRDERRRIHRIVDERLGSIASSDLAVLGFAEFTAALEAGIAAHHAGMVPPFKETVEACFTEGLVKIVYATETLALGINMPARSVVIEKLSKFTGDHHAALTPGEYTQLTGRAGRRGIDPLGHAIVLWSPFVTFDEVAALALSREFHLRSAFRPTFNMAANLVAGYTSEEAHRLIGVSFAQFQADRDVVGLEARLHRRRAQLAELRAAALSPYGDLDELRAERSQALPERPTRGMSGTNAAIVAALAELRPGDVLYLEHGRYSGRVAVLSVANRKGGIKLQTLTPTRHTITVADPDFRVPPRVLGQVELPVPFAPNRQSFRRDVARALDAVKLAPRPPRRHTPPDAEGHHFPVEDDPELGARLHAAAHADRVAAEVVTLEERVTKRAGTLRNEFDTVLGVLARRGYLDGWELTDAGRQLARTFHECDLLIVEATRAGLLDGLDPAAMAGIVSVFVYEHRSPEPPPPPWFPSAAVRRRFLNIAAISDELLAEEAALGLSIHRPPDPTFFAVAYAWAAGDAFAEVIETEELSGGDFVRTVKQLVDLLGQLAETAPHPATRRTAAAAAERLFRGVVAASAAVTVDGPRDEVLPGRVPRDDR